MTDYYACDELQDRNTYLWSFREDTDESLMLVLVDENAKKFIKENTGLVDEDLQDEIASRLIQQGYEIEYTPAMKFFDN